MRDLLRSSAMVARREWARLTADRWALFLTLGVPLALFPLVAGIYVRGVVRDIPVGVLDEDRSELSRLIVRSLDATAAFQVVESEHSIDEIRSAFRAGRIRGAFLMPDGLERDLKRGKRSEVVVFNDATNLVVSNLTLKEASTVVATVSAGIALKQLRSRGMGEEAALAAVMPVRVHAQALYNPAYNYADYLVSGLIPALFQLTVMTMVVLLIAGEVADGTFAELVRTAHGRPSAILLGKAAPYLFLHCVTSAGILWVLYPLIHITTAGSPAALYFLYVLFVTSALCVGIAISSLVRDRMFATEVAFFINIPAFIISGYIFPVRAMPLPYVIFADLLPYTHFLNAYISVGRMGLALADAAAEVCVLVLFVALSGVASLVMIRKRVRTGNHDDGEGGAGE